MPRRIEPELLDHAPQDVAEASLRDLRRINRWFGGASSLGWALRGLERASVLDVGAASGEVARVLPKAKVVSLDRIPRNLADAPRPAVAGDAFHLPFADASFDAVACSLFLHHFTDGAIVEMLREFQRVARRSIVVVDLERHWLAERFLPVTRPLFRWAPITVHDGAISVRAAFRPDELRQIAGQSGLTRLRVRRHIPWFRLSLVATLD